MRFLEILSLGLYDDDSRGKEILVLRVSFKLVQNLSFLLVHWPIGLTIGLLLCPCSFPCLSVCCESWPFLLVLFFPASKEHMSEHLLLSSLIPSLLNMKGTPLQHSPQHSSIPEVLWKDLFSLSKLRGLLSSFLSHSLIYMMS